MNLKTIKDTLKKSARHTLKDIQNTFKDKAFIESQHDLIVGPYPFILKEEFDDFIKAQYNNIFSITLFAQISYHVYIKKINYEKPIDLNMFTKTYEELDLNKIQDDIINFLKTNSFSSIKNAIKNHIENDILELLIIKFHIEFQFEEVILKDKVPINTCVVALFKSYEPRDLF